MKNLLVRAAVLALAVVGFSAASASTKNVNMAKVQAPKTGMAPLCWPNSGQTCGIQ